MKHTSCWKEKIFSYFDFQKRFLCFLSMIQKNAFLFKFIDKISICKSLRVKHFSLLFSKQGVIYLSSNVFLFLLPEVVIQTNNKTKTRNVFFKINPISYVSKGGYPRTVVSIIFSNTSQVGSRRSRTRYDRLHNYFDHEPGKETTKTWRFDRVFRHWTSIVCFTACFAARVLFLRRSQPYFRTIFS